MLFLAGMAHAYMGFYFDAGVLKGRCVCFACVYVQYVCVYVLVRGCISGAYMFLSAGVAVNDGAYQST